VLADPALHQIAAPTADQKLPETDAAAPPAQDSPQTPTAPAPTRPSRQPRSRAVLAIACLVGAIGVSTMMGNRHAGVQPHELSSPVQAAAPPHSSAPQPTTARSAGAAALESLPEKKEPTPQWTTTNLREWRKDRRGSVTFELVSDHDVPVWNKRVRPVLTVRCIAGSTDVFVLTHSAASFEHDAGLHTVHLTFDTDQPVEQKWEDSIEHDALFAPDGRSLGRHLARAKTMSFEFTPFNAPPVTIDFAVEGLAPNLTSSAKACGQK